LERFALGWVREFGENVGGRQPWTAVLADLVRHGIVHISTARDGFLVARRCIANGVRLSPSDLCAKPAPLRSWVPD